MTDTDAENPWKSSLRRLPRRRRSCNCCRSKQRGVYLRPLSLLNYRIQNQKLFPHVITSNTYYSWIDLYLPNSVSYGRSRQFFFFHVFLAELTTKTTEALQLITYLIDDAIYLFQIKQEQRDQTKALLFSLEYITKSTYLMTLILTVLKDRMANKFAIMVENPGAKQDWAMNPSFSSAKQITSSPCFQSHDGMLSKYAWKKRG